MVVLTVWMLTEKYPNFSGNFYHLRAGLYSKLAPQQGDAVTAIFCAAGFVGIKNCKDLAGRDRALIFSKA